MNFSVSKVGWDDIGLSEADFYDPNPNELETVIELRSDSSSLLATVEGSSNMFSVLAPLNQNHIFAEVRTCKALPNISTKIFSRTTIRVEITLT